MIQTDIQTGAMSRHIRLLRGLFCVIVITALALVVIFETSMAEGGQVAENDVAKYWMGIGGVAMVLAGVPLAMRMMRFEAVRRSIAASPTGYLRWSILRLALLYVPLTFNVLAYYMTGCEATYAYLALIVAVAMLFVWPSRGKAEYECQTEYDVTETPEPKA